MKKNILRLSYFAIAIILIYIGFEWIPLWFSDSNTLIFVAFIIGILVSLCSLQMIYTFSSFKSFKSRKTNELSNPLIEFALKIFIPLTGVSVITLLCIHYLLRKPVIDFNDGKAAMALKGKIQGITTHRSIKYEVHVSFLTEELKKVETYDMLFKEELKYIQKLDSLPIVYSSANPKRIAIITTDSKLQKIKNGK